MKKQKKEQDKQQTIITCEIMEPWTPGPDFIKLLKKNKDLNKWLSSKSSKDIIKLLKEKKSEEELFNFEVPEVDPNFLKEFEELTFEDIKFDDKEPWLPIVEK